VPSPWLKVIQVRVDSVCGPWLGGGWRHFLSDRKKRSVTVTNATTTIPKSTQSSTDSLSHDVRQGPRSAAPDALPPAARAELRHVLRLPDFDRADRIGEFWGYPESRAFAELLIDCEEDRTLRAVLVGMLRETD
jgi:hypothetical protein